MSECPWAKEVANDNSPLYTGKDMDTDVNTALMEVIKNDEVDLDSLDVVEAGMIVETSPKAQSELKDALAACACNGSGCSVVLAIEKISNYKDEY